MADPFPPQSLPPHPRRHRPSRESPYREETVVFRNSLGLALKGHLLSKWTESPFSSPHHKASGAAIAPSSGSPPHPAHPSSLTATLTFSTPSTSPPSLSSSPSPSPSSYSPSSAASLLQSSLTIDPSPSPSLFPRAVILCHGMAAHQHWGFLPELSDALLKEVPGISAVLRFDFTGCGGSEGDFEYGGYGRQASDVGSAVQWLRSRGYGVWALVGHSMGGNAVLLYAADHHDIPHVVNLSARYQMTRGLPFGSDQLSALQSQGFFLWRPKGDTGGLDEVKVTQATMNERLSLDMDCVRRITARTLTVHGTTDAVIPVADAHAYAELIPAHTLRTLDDADHNYSSAECRLLLVTTVCEWLSKAGRESISGSPALTPVSPARGVLLPPVHPLVNGGGGGGGGVSGGPHPS